MLSQEGDDAEVSACHRRATVRHGPAAHPSGHGRGGRIVAFENEDFLGDHLHLFGTMKDLGKWGNSISSLVILSGTWEFFDDEHFTGTSMGTPRPGTYADVTKHGLKHNSISSVRLAKSAGASTL